MLLKACSSVAALALASIPLGGCHVALVGMSGVLQPSYSAGDLAREYGDRSHALTTVGCFDVALSARTESARTVLEWQLGNRCLSPAEADLSRAVTYEEGHAPLRIHDPDGEIGPRTVGPRREVSARLALEGGSATRRLCVDPSLIAGAAPDRAPHPLCLVASGDGPPWYRAGEGT